MRGFLSLFLTVFCGVTLFARPFSGKDLILRGHAKLENGVVKLNGTTDFIELAGTENWNIGKKGLTCAGSFKLYDNASGGGKKESLDMFFSKGGTPFIFGRYGNYGHQLYSNIRPASSDGKMKAPVMSEFTPEPGVWHHFAVVYEPYNDHAQGDVGYYTTTYVDGNRAGHGKHSFLEPAQTAGRIEVGKGWGGPWFFHGEVAEINVFQEALNEAAVEELVAASRHVKFRSARKINPALGGLRAVSPAGKWALQSLHRLEPERGKAAAAKLKAAFEAADDETFIRAFDPGCGVALIVRPQVLILIGKTGGTGEPLLGIYDRIGRKSVLEDKLLNWSFSGRIGNRKTGASSGDLKYTVKDLDGRGFTAVWQGNGRAGFTAESRYEFLDDGIAADLRIDNRTPGLVLREVTFPETRTPKLGSDDAFLYPFQCGAEVRNPTRNSFRHGQFGRYPSSTMTMQFTAYYGGGRGVFLGWQDPRGTLKNMRATGKRGGMEFSWQQSVAIPLGKLAGGNSYASPGRVVFRVYPGRWYEACMLHKKWALSHAVWRVPVPRRDTPEWFKNIPAVFNYTVINHEIAMARFARLMAIRNYLDVPVYCVAYAWNDPALGGWPYFRPRKFIPGIYSQIRKAGCVVEPYIDSRLWDVMDGPDRKTDWRYSSHGKKFAVIDENGKIPLEHYTRSTYAVMCPCVRGWQEELFGQTAFVRTLAPAVYHDQVMAGHGIPCFNPDHGHALNDPAAWLDKGYRPLFRRIRKAMPGVVQTSEEVSEAYLDLFDGGHVWRWVFDGQVPAFQAVYGGRMQYYSLVFDSHGKGEYASNFVKMGNSLVNGLKLGKFELEEVHDADMKRLFIKKMCHLRQALNDYFNNGDMLPPIRFADPLPLLTTGWSTSSKALEKVTMPKIVSNSYRLGDTDVFIFVNTTGENLSCRPLIRADHLCVEGASSPVKFSSGKGIALGPYQSAAAVKGSADEARKLQKTLHRIAAFTPGESFDNLVRFADLRRIAAVRGKWLKPADASGYYNLSKSASGKYFGNTVQGALISYGVVDFGAEKVSKLFIRAAVPESYSGGTVEVLAGPAQNSCRVAGKLTVPATGSWLDFREFVIPLEKPLTGECFLMFRFDRNGCCNFSEWRF
ncbi:MAG: carbohydrate-binding protein [Lentisphaeria bacterium]|nr:carbohydrate-binding protein [Lentisphaeria bacterium]